MDGLELAWTAGFWDGEGSAYLTGALDRAVRQPQARINQSSTIGVPEVLTRFQRAVGFGVIKGPDLDEGREPLYRWVVSSRGDVERAHRVLEPWLGAVKRAQFRDVLGHPAQDASPERARETSTPADELAWAAGLWDGEGCVSLLKHGSHGGYFVVEASITQSSANGVPQVLERFRSAVKGMGAIYGPYDAGPDHLPVFRWRLYPTLSINEVIESLRPWLGDAKRRQAAERLAQVMGQSPLPRGNPAWGSHKTHCIHGHEYASARLRPFRGRGKNESPPRASHQCLACVRDQARQRRHGKERKGASR